MSVRHIILFKVREGVPPEVAEDAVTKLRTLHDLPGILEWRVEFSTDVRKGTVIVENALFASAADIAAFRVNPRHAETSAIMASISDWWVGDYEE